MLKVNNKKVIQDLAKTTYKANKKRNLLTIVAIFLTTFLLCTVISIGLSYWDTVSLRQQRIQGIDYDIELTEPRDDQVSTIRKMDNVKYAGLNVKCGIVSKYQDKELDKLKLYWLDDTCWKQQTIPALDYYKGSYPTKENEIMLSQSALRSIGIKKPKVGMELPFIYQTLAENSENNDTAKTFILSGWFLDYTGVDKGYVSDKFYQSTGVLQTDLTEGTLKISLKNPLYSEKDIIEMQNQINLSGKQIIKADYDTISNFINTMIGLLVLLVLVFMSGYLFIYNTLYISVNRDIRYFGQLKTIGTTSIQIRKMIYKQMLWNSTMGIPLGLVCSAIVGKIIIPQLLHSLNPTIAPNEVGTISLGVFIIATIFSLATTMISSQKPVKIAMNCSPIEAMKYIGATSIKNKNKKRTGGNILSMVKMNLFRDKKQFVVIMCSLSLAVSLFLIINVVIYANNAKNILNHSYDYDIKDLKKCRRGSQEETEMIADHIHSLICSTYGHTLVLFTSYHLMGNVYQMLRDEIPFPMIEVWRHSPEEITRFKQTDNAVLFAAGSCWEGVDFPGDMVSSLIIVKLPFAVPDPISEAQKKEYDCLKDYIQAVVVPDMQKKLRQGFGRALRTETDTCVVTILDERAGEDGRYHEEVMCALPKCKMAEGIKDVQRFIRNRKGVEYYL